MQIGKWLMAGTVGLTLGACAHSGSATTQAMSPAKAEATVMGLNRSGVTGTVMLSQVPEGVKVEGKITGLAPDSVHGFHIHETGNCETPDGSSAGPHFNPAAEQHGDLVASHSHMGDLGNIQADKTGSAMVSFLKAGAVLSGPEGFAERAIIVHEKRDDLNTQPAGNSGGRIGCGVIKMAAAK